MKDEDLELIEEEFEGQPADSVVAALIDELQHAYAAGSSIDTRREAANRWRFCEWDGQSEDGRKRQEQTGQEVHPFEGAPDNRIHLVDGLINENAALLEAAFWGADIQSKPTTFANLQESSNINVLLEWMRDNALREQLTGEVELLANLQEGDDPAFALLGIFWDPKPVTLPMEIALTQLQELAAAKGMQLLEGFWDDGEQDREGALRTLFGGKFTPAAVKHAVEQFDADPAAASLTFYYRVERGLPRFIVLQPGLDVWADWQQDDLQEVPALFMKEDLTKTELRSRIESEGYDESWVEAVLEQAPRQRAFEQISTTQTHVDALSQVESEANKTWEIFRCYRKIISPLTDAPQTRMTVFSYFVPDAFGLDEPIHHARGLYPFVAFSREHVKRGMLETRGISRIAGTQQSEIKTNRDCRGAALQLATLPPVKYNALRGGINLALAPGRQIPVRSRDDFEFASPPPFPNAAIKMEESVRADVDEYFFRARPEGSPTRSQLGQQRLVNKWLNRWSTAFTYALGLLQEYMPEAELSQILSVELGRELLPRIAGEYTTTLKFDVRDRDMEFLSSKSKLLGDILMLDTQGQIDRAGLAAASLHAIDPTLARRFVRDMGSVTEQEVNDEKNNIVKMFLGMTVEPKESGQNYQLRYQTLVQELQSNPKMQQAFSSDEDFQKKVTERLKHFEFMLQQQQNAQIGRVGVDPRQAAGQ